MSIRKLRNKDGSLKYEAKVMIQGKRLFKRFAKPREAEAWINEVRFKRDNKITVHKTKITVDMLFESYLEFARNKGRAEATLAKAQTNYDLYLKPLYDDNDMTLVSVEDHEFFLGKLKEFKLKPATINRVRSLLSVMFNVAIKKRRFNGAITTNPFTCIERMDEVKEDILYWEQPEVDRFLGHTRGTPLYPFWVTLLNTGLRVGEAVALDASQIDSSAHLLHVNRTWCKVTKSIQNKTKNGKRIVPLSPAVQEILYPILRSRTRGLVFTDAEGRMLYSERLIRSVLPQLCKEADVKYIGLHGFRHTFATLYMQNGGSITDLQYILGHSTPKLTHDYYVHFSKEHIRRRANVVSVGGNVMQVDFKKAGVAV
jgi:integrase